MESFSVEELADRVGGRYTLVVAAAKRARQLKDGAVPLVKVASNNPLTIALAEIRAGKVIVKAPGEPGDEPEVRPGARVVEPRLSEEDLLAATCSARLVKTTSLTTTRKRKRTKKRRTRTSPTTKRSPSLSCSL